MLRFVVYMYAWKRLEASLLHQPGTVATGACFFLPFGLLPLHHPTGGYKSAARCGATQLLGHARATLNTERAVSQALTTCRETSRLLTSGRKADRDLYVAIHHDTPLYLHRLALERYREWSRHVATQVVSRTSRAVATQLVATPHDSSRQLPSRHDLSHDGSQMVHHNRFRSQKIRHDTLGLEKCRDSWRLCTVVAHICVCRLINVSHDTPQELTRARGASRQIVSFGPITSEPARCGNGNLAIRKSPQKIRILIVSSVAGYRRGVDYIHMYNNLARRL